MWQRSGSCNQCGKCCQTMVGASFMVGYEPPEPARLGCQFLKKKSEVYVCEITEGWFSDPCKVKVGSRIRRNPQTGALQEITQQVYDYWVTECQPYPDPNDPSHCPPRHELLPECGFTLTWVE